VITTSPTAASVFVETFGDAVSDKLHVIEHGRSFPEQQHLAEAPDSGGRIRIVMLGNLLTRSKGFGVVRELSRRDRERRLEFHFVGPAPLEAAEIGVVHGRYERDRLAEIIEDIRPAFVGILSIWPETYCHTLSESWAMGIPAVVSNLGATGERVHEHGGGVAVDPTDIEATYRAILAAAEPETYERLLSEASIENLRTLDAMGRDYVALYREALGRPLGSTVPAAASGVLAGAAAAWIDDRQWAPRRGTAASGCAPASGEQPSSIQRPTGADGNGMADAAVLLAARRVARWMQVWRPRTRSPREKVLLVGGAASSWPDVPDTATRMTVRFDADMQAKEMTGMRVDTMGSHVRPEVFDALVERLCHEIYLADRVVLLPATPPSVALVVAGAVDALGGTLTAEQHRLAAHEPAPWTLPEEEAWIPHAVAEPASAEQLRAKLEAALSAPLAAL